MLRTVGVLLLPLLLVAGEPQFEAHVIDADLPAGYQVRIVDLNGDGRSDVIGLPLRGETLFWYENPGWKRRPIVSGMDRMITLDVADLDGDGLPEIAMGAEFSDIEENSDGTVYILRRKGSTEEMWEAEEIDQLPTTHRVRFFDVDGDGVLELVNSPLSGPGCRRPLYECDTPVVFYEPSDWKRRYVTTALDGVVHSMAALDWDGPAILTASMAGVDLFRPGDDGGWSRSRLSDGAIAPRPRNGSSEAELGRLPEGRFFATIEPWHGNEVVVYCCEGAGFLDREVIDITLRDGHALKVADFDADGQDEVVSGMRGEPFRVAVYRRGDAGWTRTVVDDGGMAAAGCDVADIDGDGDADIACIGTRTGNVKWYENNTSAAR